MSYGDRDPGGIVIDLAARVRAREEARAAAQRQVDSEAEQLEADTVTVHEVMEPHLEDLGVKFDDMLEAAYRLGGMRCHPIPGTNRFRVTWLSQDDGAPYDQTQGPRTNRPAVWPSAIVAPTARVPYEKLRTLMSVFGRPDVETPNIEESGDEGRDVVEGLGIKDLNSEELLDLASVSNRLLKRLAWQLVREGVVEVRVKTGFGGRDSESDTDLVAERPKPLTKEHIRDTVNKFGRRGAQHVLLAGLVGGISDDIDAVKDVLVWAAGPRHTGRR